MANIKLFALNGNRPLAEKVATALNMELSPASVKHFADGEIQIDIDKSIRGADVYVIQSVSDPVNENFMELMIMVDALRRASAHLINVVIPYYGYARADRKARAREPITAKMVANMIEMDGVDRVITVDLHADQVQGFFDIPVDHLRALPLLAHYFEDHGIVDNVVTIAPDHSGTKLARKLAEHLGSPLAIVDARPGEDNVGVIGDVAGKTAIIVDDMIDTANRIEESVTALQEAGVKDIYACATHAVLSAGAATRLGKLPLKKIVVTDTIDIPEEKCLDNMVKISVGNLIGTAIEKISKNQSIHDLFED
ncbi:ribose-phosphate diphosphokinase [Lacticaseibacillus hulanensis]|jgi:ribose-phosphate pyrophosphokinase|uniref:ribose-phosphate diphosphokinase n=1 Tax=Lacticaseibacillus hulanensis TaxID=2493111 RepID=UPI000FDA92A9|nr:ribose-phosphate pyrophosphokinase [Lacticaseibacillus hulanensis]